MPGERGIALHRLVLSLSEALDWARPDSPDNRQRATYIAVRLGQQMDLPAEAMRDVFLAAVMQEPVLEGLSQSLAGRSDGGADPMVSVMWAARRRRTRWNHGRGGEVEGRPVPPAAHVLHLAESVAAVVDRNFPVLAQAESIIKQVVSRGGAVFQDCCVEAFADLAGTEAFWLDCVSPRLHSLIARHIRWPSLPVTDPIIQHIARVFGGIVDSLSHWTAGHSAGVAAVAGELAQRTAFSPADQAAMRLAGWLHDLGKLSAPAHVLDKAARLSRQEWAVVKGHPYYTHQILRSTGGPARITEWAGYHHERLDGRGYPFGYGERRLSRGARIMAVADAYTAVMQDRPYRPAMTSAKAAALLEAMASNGALDGEIVALLSRHRESIERRRIAEQALPTAA